MKNYTITVPYTQIQTVLSAGVATISVDAEDLDSAIAQAKGLADNFELDEKFCEVTNADSAELDFEAVEVVEAEVEDEEDFEDEDEELLPELATA